MSQKYIKKDHISHILDKSEMYIGSIISRKTLEYTVVDDSYRIQKKEIDISPGILRIFLEPLQNAVDNVARSRQGKNKPTKIAVEIDEKSGLTSVWNDGEIVPVEINPKEKCYNHTMIFGQLLTSSNYDDTENRTDISGTFGIGIKACNIFSTEFTVEGVDTVNKKYFSQTWRNNMKSIEEPIIAKSKLDKGYTKVIFIPDFQRFGLKGYTQDIINIYKKCMVDISMITKVTVIYNGEQIPVKNLADYSKLYSTAENTPTEFLTVKTTDCEVVLTTSESDFESISFANGMYTPLDGSHVNPWMEALFRPIVEKLNRPKKPQINISDVKKFFKLFVVAKIINPIWNSASKLKLESPTVEAEVKKSHIASICRWSVMEKLEDVIRFKEMSILKKAERKKRGYEKVEGLIPANYEGGKKGRECILILVEGLSAKTYATRGIQTGAFGRHGSDWFGIYALRGKVLNCRNAKPVTVVKNHVVSDIIKCIGLQHGIDYTLEENYKKLRYGKVLLLTDSDTDGYHISALLQNMFHALFPSLLQREESYITSMQTPIVRVYLGKTDMLFYDEQEYRRYVQTMGGKKITKKYYKGLATSSSKEVRETFGRKIVQFINSEKTLETMNKAFSNKNSDMRKEWLEQYDQSKTVLKWTGNKEEKIFITFSDFIDTELIKFSIDDCKRSIPNLIDGLKEGHQKVLYVSFMRKLKKETKVEQLAGSVSEKSGYHHGAQNLHSTIIGMASSYVGSNNIPYFYRGGGFGTRLSNGKDAGAARYLMTRLENIIRLIFRPEDDPLLEQVEDDGEKVQPKYYVPIIPMILVNGMLGIGTGWSCSVPAYNPLDLIGAIKIWLEYKGKVIIKDSESVISLLPDLKPWYRGYTGEIIGEGEQKFISWGCIEKNPSLSGGTKFQPNSVGAKGKKVIITELPVGLWTDDYTEMLGKLKEEGQIKDFLYYCTPEKIHYEIIEADTPCTLENLKLYTYLRTSNMVLFTEQGQLKKFSNVDEIIDSYCQVRYSFYVKRKIHLLSVLEHQIKFLGNKRRFLEEVRDGEIKLFETAGGKRRSRKIADVISELETRGYDRDTEGEKEKNVFEDEEELEGKAEDEFEGKAERKSDSSGYEYLLRLQISSITAEKIGKLKNDIANSIKDRDELKSASEKDLWIKDLSEFENAYEKWLIEIEKETYEEQLEKYDSGKKGKKKKVKK